MQKLPTIAIITLSVIILISGAVVTWLLFSDSDKLRQDTFENEETVKELDNNNVETESRTEPEEKMDQHPSIEVAKYKNTQYGYSLTYPSSWILDDSDPRVVTITPGSSNPPELRITSFPTGLGWPYSLDSENVTTETFVFNGRTGMKSTIECDKPENYSGPTCASDIIGDIALTNYYTDFKYAGVLNGEPITEEGWGDFTASDNRNFGIHVSFIGPDGKSIYDEVLDSQFDDIMRSFTTEEF